MGNPPRLPAMQALRAFEATARSGSLTRAAELLSLTHGAISHQIKALEEELGVTLIERAGRGMRLTDEGERFASRVRVALAELGEAVRELSERRNPRQLRITVLPSFAARWLLPRIGRFMAAHREIDVDVRASNAIADFRHDDLDLGIRHGFGDWPGLVVEKLMEDSYFPVCSPRIAGGVPKRPADLARYTLLRSEGEPWKPWFEAAGLDREEPTRGPIFSDSSHTLHAAIEGQGIALARISLLGNDLVTGALVRPFDIEIPSAKGHYLVYPQRLASAPKILLFREWLLEELEKDRALRPLRARSRPGRGRSASRAPGARGRPPRPSTARRGRG
ncbi:MAG TPA: transcriptional regulator GcvA [Usitatibacter sp.]|nr:transcriptional regulator GcvA [Usitatibacter sp.]